MRLPGLLLLLCCLLSACGQKGPLYLPESDAPNAEAQLDEGGHSEKPLNYKERP